MRAKREPQRLVLEMQQLRHSLNIEQRELTKKAGLSENSLREWVKNGVIPTIESFDMALKAMGYKLKIVEDNEAENEEEDHHE